jgi:hypothetical protein
LGPRSSVAEIATVSALVTLTASMIAVSMPTIGIWAPAIATVPRSAVGPSGVHSPTIRQPSSRSRAKFAAISTAACLVPTTSNAERILPLARVRRATPRHACLLSRTPSNPSGKVIAR